MTLRAHSETPVLPAAFSITFHSVGVTRARIILLLASPLGSFGLPVFMLCLCATKSI